MLYVFLGSSHFSSFSLLSPFPILPPTLILSLLYLLYLLVSCFNFIDKMMEKMAQNRYYFLMDVSTHCHVDSAPSALNFYFPCRMESHVPSLVPKET